MKKPPSGMPPGEKFYPLTNDEWLTAITTLTESQKDVLYYLRTLDPFGDRNLEIGVRELARILNYDPSTISRALKTLDIKGFIDLELINVRVRVKTCGKTSEKSFSSDKECCSDATLLHGNNSNDSNTTPAIAPQHLNHSSEVKTLANQASPDHQRTNNRSNLLEQPNTPTHPPVSGMNKESFGTVSQQLLQVEQAGIRLNKTIRTEIQRLTTKLGEPAAALRIRNALSAVTEQQAQGTVRNPGGLFVAALRRSYTSNQAKQQAREPKPPQPEAPNMNQVAITVDAALMQGDRTFALTRLQELWQAGWREQVEQLCILRKRDWQFIITNEGISDGI